MVDMDACQIPRDRPFLVKQEYDICGERVMPLVPVPDSEVIQIESSDEENHPVETPKRFNNKTAMLYLQRHSSDTLEDALATPEDRNMTLDDSISLFSTYVGELPPSQLPLLSNSPIAAGITHHTIASSYEDTCSGGIPDFDYSGLSNTFGSSPNCPEGVFFKLFNYEKVQCRDCATCYHFPIKNERPLKLHFTSKHNITVDGPLKILCTCGYVCGHKELINHISEHRQDTQGDLDNSLSDLSLTRDDLDSS